MTERTSGSPEKGRLPSRPRETEKIISDLENTIAEQKALVEVLSSAYQRYRDVVEHLPVFVCSFSPDGTLTYVNESLAAYVGVPAEKLRGSCFYSFLSPESGKKTAEAIASLTVDNPVCVVEEEVLLPDGTRRWLQWIDRAVFDEKGALVSCHSVGRDISDIKKAQAECAQERDLFMTLVSSLRDGVNILDGTLTITYANPTQESWYAHAMPLVGKKCYEAFQGRKTPCENCPALTTLATGKAASETVVRRGPDGSIVGWLDLRTYPLVDSATGKMTGVVKHVRDITNERRAAELLAQNGKEMRKLWQEAPIAYHILDEHGTILDVNRKEQELLGYAREEMVGRPIFDFVLPEQRKDARQRFAEKLRGKHVPPSRDRIYVTKDGRHIFVSIRDTIERNGTTVRVRSQMTDVTRERALEEDLRRSQRALREMVEGMAKAIIRILELRDPYTAGHQRRVTQLCGAIARRLSLPERRTEILRLAASLHDIGKIYVPAELLSRPGILLPQERLLVNHHAELGKHIIIDVGLPAEVATIIAQHHERMDGSGYPAELQGEDIVLEARILAVADVTEAMQSHRPYRPAHSLNEALDEIRSQAGVRYDREVVEACLAVFSEGFVFT